MVGGGTRLSNTYKVPLSYGDHHTTHPSPSVFPTFLSQEFHELIPDSGSCGVARDTITSPVSLCQTVTRLAWHLAPAGRRPEAGAGGAGAVAGGAGGGWTIEDSLISNL